MKNKAKNKTDRRASMVVPAELNAQFRSICEAKMMKPYAVHLDLLSSWIEREREKTHKTTRRVNS